MSTTSDEIAYSGMTRIAGQAEDIAVDAVSKLGKNRFCVDSEDVLDTAGVHGILTVGTTAVEVKVSTTRLSNRKCVTLFNNGSVTMYWGFSNTVTTSNGTPIFKNQSVYWEVGPNLAIWVISSLANQEARITEAS